MGDGLKRAKAAAARTRSKGKWLPGFLTSADARAAGEAFYAKTNGLRGWENQDFHIVQNEHGRWHFAEGPSPGVPTLCEGRG